MGDALVDAIVELREDDAVRLAEEALDSGADPSEILLRCQAGMTKVGELFEKKQYYLSELIYSGAIFKRISALLDEALVKRGDAESRATKGAVVVGTIQGDVHDLGKNIVVMLLRGSGYEVFDLGVDVPPERFIEKLEETQARVVGISALLTTSFPGMKRVVELMTANGLRQSVRVMIGGGVVDESCRKFVGADIQSRNAYDAVTFCNKSYER